MSRIINRYGKENGNALRAGYILYKYFLCTRALNKTIPGSLPGTPQQKLRISTVCIVVLCTKRDRIIHLCKRDASLS